MTKDRPACASALAPDAGETTAQRYAGFAPTHEFDVETGNDGYGVICPARFKAGFAHYARDADAAFLRDAQMPINMAAFQTPLARIAERIGTKITRVAASTPSSWPSQRSWPTPSIARPGSRTQGEAARHLSSVRRLNRWTMSPP